MYVGTAWLKKRPWQLRYGLAVITTVVSLLIRLLLVPILGLAGPFLLFAPAIMLSAWYGGFKPGLVATALSCLLANYFLVEHTNSLAIATLSDLVRMLVFAVIGVQISFLSGRLLSERWRALASARQAEAVADSLERSEKRYRLMIENVRDYAIYSLDPAGSILSWNNGAERLQGYEANEVIGRHFSCFYVPDEVEQGLPQQALDQAAAEGRWEQQGWRMRKDGSRFWADIVLTALWDETGSLRAFSEVVRDISDRKESEERLRQSLCELTGMQFALDQAAILAITDCQGTIEYVNDKFCEISKYSREELLGQNHRILNSGYHPKEFFHHLWSTIRQGQIWYGEIKNRAKDGTIYWVNTTIVPFLDGQGSPHQYMAIRFDITPQKQAEADLQELNDSLEAQVKERTAQLRQALSFEATLKRITDKVRDSLDESQILQTAVQALGEGLGVRSCNAALYDLEQSTSTICYEYSTSLIPVKGRVAQIEVFPELYQPLLEGQYIQFCNIVPNPIRGRVAMLACPIFDDQGVLGDLWLISDKDYVFRENELRLVQQVANQCAIALRQAHLYQEAQTQVQALERLNWLKDDFLSTVSHELRTPVSNIKLSVRMLELVLNQEDGLNGSRQKALKYLEILKNECEREISLINDLLDLQRLEAGKRALDLETIAVDDWLKELTQPFKERARSREQTLEIRLPPQTLPPLMSDIPALERILSELLNNACKYTPPGETIEISVAAHSDLMQFIVSNSGVEIPAHELCRIFDKFYRVPNGDPWKQGGTGLGLALVQKLAQHLGGDVRASCSANQTAFTVEVVNQAV
ncbi:PAS domain S-box protein [Pseudanabaena sp. FACHB-2040]|uniref:PAS domain S-box protein n=1 Tax=Pseudanabaena sp. FACHB-2040 TaxID=2692859 RepID=UPI0016855B8E|nr:PAS domain S-box protein [Pseudanabaena sp. FACHB-2040]MBD2256275.1 PAS domain S-box protein [Pseudanabaena sp. FACHB-2040]